MQLHAHAAAATRARPRVSYGSWASVRGRFGPASRADHRPQARAPAVPGDDLLATARAGDTRPPGQPGGLFRVSGPILPTDTDRPTDTAPDQTRHQAPRSHPTERVSRGKWRCSPSSPPQPSNRNAGESRHAARTARPRSSTCSSPSSSTTSSAPRRSARSARCGSPCLNAAHRAARAVGRVGRRALRQRQGAGAEAPARASAEGARRPSR